jgi:hypothetical protein
MINEVIHSTTPIRRHPTAPAPRAPAGHRRTTGTGATGHGQLLGSDRQRRHARRHRLPDAHAGAAENQDPTSPVDSNTFLSAAGLAQRSAGHHPAQHLVQRAVEFAHFQPGAAGVLAARTSSAGRESDGDLDERRRRTISGAVSVPQTSSQVVLNITNSAGVWCSRSISARSRRASRIFHGTGKPPAARRRPPGPTPLSAQVSGVAGGTAVTDVGQRHRRQRDHGRPAPLG